jgi:hypothetical protein
MGRLRYCRACRNEGKLPNDACVRDNDHAAWIVDLRSWDRDYDKRGAARGARTLGALALAATFFLACLAATELKGVSFSRASTKQRRLQEP